MAASLRPRAGSLVRKTRSALRGVFRALTPHGEQLRNAAGLPVPVYLTPSGIPSAQPRQGPIPHRAMVCSIPKAGTYLVDEVLRRLGTVPTGFHFSTDGLMVTDSRFATREEARNEFGRLCHAIPIERVLPLILPGQHAVSHLECTPRTRGLLSAFKVVFVYRELRDAFVSWLRFHVDTGREAQWNGIWPRYPDKQERLVAFLREAGALFFGTCRLMQPWFADLSALPVRFETLHGDDGHAAREQLCRELAAFLGHADPTEAPVLVLPGLTTTPTLTSSGSRTKRDEYWSEAAEELFLRFGGGELNAAFGYDAAFHPRLTSGTPGRS